MERKWKDEGLRYGELRDIGEAVVREISAVHDEKKLRELVERAYHLNLPEKVKTNGCLNAFTMDFGATDPGGFRMGRFSFKGQI